MNLRHLSTAIAAIALGLSIHASAQDGESQAPNGLAPGVDAVANTGGGGSGAAAAIRATLAGGKGGSGLVVVRYKMPAQADGGTASEHTDSNGTRWRVHKFEKVGQSELVFKSDTEVEYLIGGGGGAGGGVNFVRCGGGGGGGGVLHGSKLLTAGSYPIVVGKGGDAASGKIGTNGGDSSAFGLTAIGGGAGGSNNKNASGTPGGSGGGGASNTKGASSKQADGGLGNAGADGVYTGASPSGGGGGGAKGAGGSVEEPHVGGAGFASSITGEEQIYGQGGDGGVIPQAPVVERPDPVDFPPNPLEKSGWTITTHDEFDKPELNKDLWIPYYLRERTTDERAAARYEVRDGNLVLRIDSNQKNYGTQKMTVSSIQTGEKVGLHKNEIVQNIPEKMLFTQQYGYFEIRAKTYVKHGYHCAFWTVGVRKEDWQTAEIDIFEQDRIPGRSGFSLHNWSDPNIKKNKNRLQLDFDPTKSFNIYALEWDEKSIKKYVNNKLVKTINQSPNYPAVFFLSIYENSGWSGKPDRRKETYPKEFVIDYFRAYKKAPNQ